MTPERIAQLRGAAEFTDGWDAEFDEMLTDIERLRALLAAAHEIPTLLIGMSFRSGHRFECGCGFLLGEWTGRFSITRLRKHAMVRAHAAHLAEILDGVAP